MSDAHPISLFDLLSWYVIFLFSLIAHEASHAFASWKLGDPTAHAGGQVSLDPIPHIRREPFGTLIIPLITYAANGWMIGWASAPYNRLWAETYPRRAGLMALAGPMANLAIFLVALAAMKTGLAAGVFTEPFSWNMQQIVVATATGWPYIAARFLSIAFSLNLILLAFNLIPLPPLDGSSIIKLFLPESLLGTYSRLISHRVLALGGLLAAWFLFPRFGGDLMRFALRLLYPAG